jgi:O-antigen/teichoic acid export membrane protein
MTALAVWLMFAKSAAFILGLALPLLLVRRLSQTEFGFYKQAFLIVGSAVSILPIGFGVSAFYYLPRERDPATRAKVIFNIVLFNLVVGGLAFIVLALNPNIIAPLFHSEELTRLSPLIGAVILFWILSNFLETIAVANQEAKLATVFILGAQLSKGFFLVMAAVLFGTIHALILAALLHSILQTAILFLYLNSRFRGFWFSFSWPMLRGQLGYAVPYGFAGLLFTTQTDLHNYFVSHQFGAATFAIYSIGCLQLPLVGILSDSIASVMIPRLSALQKENKEREIVLLMTRVMRKLAAIYFPLYAFLMINGKELIRWLFTDKYIGSWPIFAVNLTLIPFYVIMLDPIVRAYAKQRYFLLRLRLALFCLLVVSLWFSVRHFGLVGVISVVVAINLLEHLIVTCRSAKIVGVRKSDVVLLKDLGKLAVCTLVAALGAALVREPVLSARPFYILVISGSVFAFIYGLSVLLLQIPTIDERESVRRGLMKLQRVIWWRRLPAPSV